MIRQSGTPLTRDPDPDVNRPERWGDLPETVKEMPGLWSNTMTFLGGNRGCIGYRFALAE